MRVGFENSELAEVTDLLAALVAADTINPMGKPRTGATPVERAAIELIEEWLAPYGDRLSMTRTACSEHHESLVVRLPGAESLPAVLFEAHLDTVPADDWRDRALKPTIRNGQLIGRGACDDKGSMVAMLLALVDLIRKEVVPPHPIVLVCAGDEEFAQTGIRHFRSQLDEPIAFAVFGEPTQLRPVIQHKGTIRWDITAHGRSAHTSRPELGQNAVLRMMEVIALLQAYQQQLQQTWSNPLLTGPLVTVTMIHGGRTRNATPDECTIAVDFRILPGMDPAEAKQDLIDYLGRQVTWKLTHGENQLMTPPLSTDPNAPFCRYLLELCREATGSHVELCGEPYGTDAAWVADLCPTVVLGPGDIAAAHAVDEHIELAEVVKAKHIYGSLMRHRLQPEALRGPHFTHVGVATDAKNLAK